MKIWDAIDLGIRKTMRGFAWLVIMWWLLASNIGTKEEQHFKDRMTMLGLIILATVDKSKKLGS